MNTFSISFSNEDLQNEELMKDFQDAMDSYHKEMVDHIIKIAEELGVSTGCAADVVYLRTRSRWTQELENELIRRSKEGISTNVCEFGFN